MLIDFHTHMFPEAVAERALGGIVKRTKDIYGIDQAVSFDGTLEGLRRSMKETGVDLSVVLPIATKVTQYITINKYAEEAKGNGIISFASLHPYQDNVKETLKDISKRGFKGIKLHPDYQGVYADDERFIDIVRYAGDLGLYTVIHAGADLGMRAPFKGDVDRLRTLMNKTDESLLIIAHMGGFNMWDDVLEKIIDTPAYFDTAVVSKYIDIDTYKKIIDRHGAEKILFGSDTPWEDPRETYAFLMSAGLSEEENEMITHKNAEKILGLK